MTKVYTYQKCSTCRKATQWLKSRGVEFQEIAIRETPPSKKELAAMLTAYEGDLRRLFNTSGMDYRALGLKDKLPTMTQKEAFQLLSENGNLVKRPFLLTDSFKSAGFKESDWAEGFS
jgi:arsenate reductase (glutaredoxin)